MSSARLSFTTCFYHHRHIFIAFGFITSHHHCLILDMHSCFWELSEIPVKNWTRFDSVKFGVSEQALGWVWTLTIVSIWRFSSVQMYHNTMCSSERFHAMHSCLWVIWDSQSNTVLISIRLQEYKITSFLISEGFKNRIGSFCSAWLHYSIAAMFWLMLSDKPNI